MTTPNAGGPYWQQPYPPLPAQQPAPRRTGGIIAAIVVAVALIAGIVTVVVVTTSSPSPTQAAGQVPPGGIVPVPQSQTSAVVAPTSGDAPVPSPVPPSQEPVPSPIVDPNGGGGVDPNGGGGVDPNGGGGVDPNGGGGVDPNGGGGMDPNGGGGVDPNGGGAAGNFLAQKDQIVQAAIAWTDAFNAGDGTTLLQLSCSDDTLAVQSGQPNPATFAGHAAYRPTGELYPQTATAGYFVVSHQNKITGATQPGRLPIIYEQGAWKVCYYPGENAQRIASGS